MQKFEESRICQSRRHCGVCRSIAKGAKWRELVGRLYETGNVDFKCHVGLPWVADDNHTVVAPKPEQEIESKPVPSPRVLASANETDTGKLLRHFDYAIRKVLPGDSKLVLKLQEVERVDRGGGCKGCRAKRLHRAIAKTFLEETDINKKLVNDIVSGSVQI